MKLWHVKQNENNDYDTFDSMVVAAESEADARQIHPYSERPWADDAWTEGLNGVWCKSPDTPTVELIGNAIPGTKAGIILASFNAG